MRDEAVQDTGTRQKKRMERASQLAQELEELDQLFYKALSNKRDSSEPKEPMDAFLEKLHELLYHGSKRLDAKTWQFIHTSLGKVMGTSLSWSTNISYLLLEMVQKAAVTWPASSQMVHILLEGIRRGKESSGLANGFDTHTRAKAQAFAVSLMEQRALCFKLKREQTVRELALNGQGMIKLAQTFDSNIAIECLKEYVNTLFDCFVHRVGRAGGSKRLARNKELNVLVKELVALCATKQVRLEVWKMSFVVENVASYGDGETVKPLVKLDLNIARAFIHSSLNREPQALRQAHHCMRECHLESEFPQLVTEYRKNVLEGVHARKKYSEAIFRLNRYKEETLTAFFIGKLLEENQHWLVDYILTRLGYSRDHPLARLVNRDECARQAKNREETHYQLRIPFSNVFFVDSPQMVHLFSSALMGLPPASAVGLDSEWKPCFTSGEITIASILQVGLRNKVFILDLLWLRSNNCDVKTREEVFSSLQRLFSRPTIFKVGFGFFGDIKQLKSSFPNATCWDEFNGLVELQRLNIVDVSTPPGMEDMIERPLPHLDNLRYFEVSQRKKPNGGFKDLVQRIYGKKLCKLEQISDWDRRPLRIEQLTYACIDVVALVDIFHTVFGNSSQVLAFSGLVSNGTQSLFWHPMPTVHRMVPSVFHGPIPNDGEEAEMEVDLGEDGLTHYIRTICSNKSFQFQVARDVADIKPTTDVSLFNNPCTNPSVKDVAAALHVDLSCTLKTMAFMVRVCSDSSGVIPASTSKIDSNSSSTLARRLDLSGGWSPIAVLIRGDCFVNERNLAKEIRNCTGVHGRIQLEKATSEQCKEYFGAKPGSLGPLSTVNEQLAVIMDNHLMEGIPATSSLFLGCGMQDKLLCVRSFKILQKLVNATTLPVARIPQWSTERESDVLHKRRSSSSTSENHGEELRFVVDNMLGRVGKMLRMFGIDCLYHSDIPGVEEKPFEPQQQCLTQAERDARKRKHAEDRRRELETIFKVAREENRVFLTTDRKVLPLARTMGIAACVVDNLSGREDQFAAVCDRFKISLLEDNFLCRCVKCNSKGFKIVAKEDLRAQKESSALSEKELPSDVLDTMDRFYRCINPQCNALYWEGPKFNHCVKNYERHFDGNLHDHIENQNSEAWQMFLQQQQRQKFV